MMKCPECGKEVEVNVKVCPNCGYPFEEENIQEDNTQHDNITEKESPNSIESGNIEKKEDTNFEYAKQVSETKTSSLNKRVFAIVGGVMGLLVIGSLVYMNSDTYKYKKAERKYTEEKYDEAAKIYKELGDYKEAKSKYKDSAHKNDVQNDKKAPEIISEADSIEIEQDDSFDVATWVEDNISVADNVTEKVEYSFDSDIDTKSEGSYAITIHAKDEAGNEQEKIISVKVENKYTLENLSASVKSVYANNDIPGLKNIEYNKNSQTIYIQVVQDGMTDAARIAKNNSSLKSSWDNAMGAIDRASERMYLKVRADGYTKIESVCIMLLNNENTDNVLYATANGSKFYDSTD